LVVRGPAPPAALVRLITPGVLVLQAASAEALAPLAAGDGPAVAALVPEGAALFRHAPAAAATGHARLTLDAVPEAAPRAIGAYTAFQQQEELRQLLELAAAPAWPEPAAGAPATNGAGEFTPADRLAAWLLKQANLDGTT
ncbi:MAG TPA: hypothetical protein VFQ38_14890, partial [Longimicrobiales bacterium]|nr:hypothetical protein [Longimicrobiales bacterium]